MNKQRNIFATHDAATYILKLPNKRDEMHSVDLQNAKARMLTEDGRDEASLARFEQAEDDFYRIGGCHWVVLLNGSPSFCHTRYKTREDAQNEVDRLIFADTAHNAAVKKRPLSGPGNALANTVRTNLWSVGERQ